MLTKKQKHLFKNLDKKKHRQASGLFVAEGDKLIQALLDANFECEGIYVNDASKAFYLAHPLREKALVSERSLTSRRKAQTVLVDEKTLKDLSFLTQPPGTFAVFYQKPTEPLPTDATRQFILALDAVRDPGNLGTLIRLCDWFGVEHLVCSEDTVDCYNPKVVQATMGSITRVQVHYVPLAAYLTNVTGPIYGATLAGESIYKKTLNRSGVLVLGNESRGISHEILKLINQQLLIPPLSPHSEVESLNVAMAGAILIHEFCRI